MGIERHFTPTYSRDRAEEFRAKAAICEHPQTKASLLRVGTAYDELARRSDTIRTVQNAEYGCLKHREQSSGVVT